MDLIFLRQVIAGNGELLQVVAGNGELLQVVAGHGSLHLQHLCVLYKSRCIILQSDCHLIIYQTSIHNFRKK